MRNLLCLGGFVTNTIVFDLDGTLISCRPRQIAALRAVSGLSGVDLSTIWEAKRAGHTTRDALREVGISTKKADEIARRWARVIETPYFLGYDRLLPGAIEALRVCRTWGLRTVILTARQSLRGVIIQSNALRLERLADEFVAVDPRDGVACKAAELQRLSACALIGDSEVDAKAAAAAAVPFIAVSSGQRSPDYLRRMLKLLPFEGVLPATMSALAAVSCEAPAKKT
jgi:phosphoglycolate phosphatase